MYSCVKLLFIFQSCTAEAGLDDHEQAAEATYPCPSCTKVFRCKDKWTRHKKSCKYDEKCPYCGQKFRMRHDLIEHVVRSHENEDPSNLVPESSLKEASEGKRHT